MQNYIVGDIKVPGGRVGCRIVGNNNQGTPLIIVHGGPGASYDYLEPLEALADERPVIFYDQLGSHRSSAPEDPSIWTLERYADELAAVRDSLAPGPVHILGQSWGAMLAIAYLSRHEPKDIASLTFSGPCISAPMWLDDQRRLLAEMPADARSVIDECEIRGVFDSPGYESAMMEYYRRHLCRLDTWPECLLKTFEVMATPVYNFMWGPSEFTLTGTLKETDLTPNLAYIKVPVLYTCGEFDEATPSTVRHFRNQTKEATIKVFPGASHSHHLEAEEDYIATVRSFLKNHSSKSGLLLPGGLATT